MVRRYSRVSCSERETVSLPNKCEYSKHPDGDQLIIPCLHDHRSSCRVGAAAAACAIRIYGNGISISLCVAGWRRTAHQMSIDRVADDPRYLQVVTTVQRAEYGSGGSGMDTVVVIGS